jgi:uncharacterized membrane protein
MVKEIVDATIPKGVKPESLVKELHSAESRLAARITNFAGSMPFVYFHGVWFLLWIVINEGFLAFIITPFDPFPYGLLTMIVSLEAIFLSAFIMVAQNRQALVDTYRELEEDKEQAEEEKEHEALEEDVEDIQDDLDKIKEALLLIQQKVGNVEKVGASQKAKTANIA